MNILITRPFPAGKELVNKLLNLGKYAYYLPLIYFSKGKSLSSIHTQLKSLSKGDALFILSQHAIKYAHFQILKMRSYWPNTITYYAIGQKTSLTMYKLSGISSKYPLNEETSESLLQFPELIHNISGRRVLILKGNNGRNLIKTTLQQRGALVLSCECYTRKPFRYDGIKQCKQMLQLNIRIIVITTENMLIQLYYLIPTYYRITWLIRCRLIVVSFRLKIIAKRLGWTDIIVTRSANNNSILQVLVQHI